MAIFSDFNNDKVIGAYIDALEIMTFGVERFKSEHMYFISKKPIPPSDKGNSFWDLILIHDYQNDLPARVEKAKSLSVRNFCVALELYNLCHDVKDDGRRIHYELCDGLKPDIELHLIKIASWFYGRNLFLYLERFTNDADCPKTDLYYVQRVLNKTIRDCFLTKRYPTYKAFLKCGSQMIYDEKLQPIFKNLLEQTEE